MALQFSTAVSSGAIGRPRHSIVATPTACTSVAVTSTQARTAAATSSTAGGWSVASLVCKIILKVKKIRYRLMHLDNPSGIRHLILLMLTITLFQLLQEVAVPSDE